MVVDAEGRREGGSGGGGYSIMQRASMSGQECEEGGQEAWPWKSLAQNKPHVFDLHK